MRPVTRALLLDFDDVLPLLGAATTAGISMGLLTNSASYDTQPKLEITGLEGVFAVVATGDTLDSGNQTPGRFATPASCSGQSRTRRSTSVTMSRSMQSQPRTRGCMPSGCGAIRATGRVRAWRTNTAYRWWGPSRKSSRCWASFGVTRPIWGTSDQAGKVHPRVTVRVP